MTDWVRRSYSGVGLTQMPPGRHLSALQEHFLGQVILCIDVSSSMSIREGGLTRLERAVAGAERFIAEAVQNHYRVGLILWNEGVSRSIPIDTSGAHALRALQAARPGGGNNIVPTLRLGARELTSLQGDRVLAVFGDGDLGDEAGAVAGAREASALGIRIIVRGLGEFATAQLNKIATDPDSTAAAPVVDAHGIEGAIASMARGLRGSRSA